MNNLPLFFLAVQGALDSGEFVAGQTAGDCLRHNWIRVGCGFGPGMVTVTPMWPSTNWRASSGQGALKFVGDRTEAFDGGKVAFELGAVGGVEEFAADVVGRELSGAGILTGKQAAGERAARDEGDAARPASRGGFLFQRDGRGGCSWPWTAARLRRSSNCWTTANSLVEIP